MGIRDDEDYRTKIQMRMRGTENSSVEHGRVVKGII
jgi:hypothetical protein